MFVGERAILMKPMLDFTTFSLRFLNLYQNLLYCLLTDTAVSKSLGHLRKRNDIQNVRFARGYRFVHGDRPIESCVICCSYHV